MRTGRGVGVAVLALLAGIAVLGVGCAGSDPPAAQPRHAPVDPKGTVTIASFGFPESHVLAELYAAALAERGVPVERSADLGSRELVVPALEQGVVDLVPEYLGSALDFLRERDGGRNDVGTTHRALTRAFADLGVRVLEPAPAEDHNVVAVRHDTAVSRDLAAISDLAPIAGNLVFGGPPDCPERPTCLRGLGDVYGLEFADFVPLRGPDEVAAALRDGDIDVGLLFSTDPSAAARDLVVLDDDRGLQPPENVVPVVREEVAAAHGDRLVDTLNSVSHQLTSEALTELNRRVGTEGETPAEAARRWLRDEGLIR